MYEDIDPPVSEKDELLRLWGSEYDEYLDSFFAEFSEFDEDESPMEIEDFVSYRLQEIAEDKAELQELA